MHRRPDSIAAGLSPRHPRRQQTSTAPGRPNPVDLGHLSAPPLPIASLVAAHPPAPRNFSAVRTLAESTQLPYEAIWSQQIGTSDQDYGKCVAVDASGNAYISGHTDGSLGGPNAGSWDAFLVKFSPIPEPSSLVIFATGGILFAGWAWRWRHRNRKFRPTAV